MVLYSYGAGYCWATTKQIWSTRGSTTVMDQYTYGPHCQLVRGKYRGSDRVRCRVWVKGRVWVRGRNWVKSRDWVRGRGRGRGRGRVRGRVGVKVWLGTGLQLDLRYFGCCQNKLFLSPLRWQIGPKHILSLRKLVLIILCHSFIKRVFIYLKTHHLPIQLYVKTHINISF